MKKILLLLIVFILWFVVWTWVWFKILEGVSSDILHEALQNSYAQFQDAYSGSKSQEAIDQQKLLLMEQLKGGVKEYLMGLFGK